jgi:hypothetical protein
MATHDETKSRAECPGCVEADARVSRRLWDISRENEDPHVRAFLGMLQAGRPVSEDFWLEFIAHLSKARRSTEVFAQSLLERTINPPVLVTLHCPRKHFNKPETFWERLAWRKLTGEWPPE